MRLLATGLEEYVICFVIVVSDCMIETTNPVSG